MCIIKELILTFDLRTIEHLGIQMYKTLPPVLAEMISNAYDADATCVDIKLLDDDPDNKQIIITDNGCGMTFQEINDSFLVIGKNRRKDNLNQTGITPKGRKVTGRKGLGKLAVFGIANHIQIKTIKNGLLNIFDMDLNDILSENSGVYRPRILKFNEPTEEISGTQISLSGIKRKNPFDSSELKESIAKRFAFSVEDFFITISKDKESPLRITNDTKWEYIDAQFEWIFDETNCLEDEFLCEKKIFGKVITTKTPLPEEQRGIFLYARGKLVNSNEFYGIKTTTSLAYNYMTGVFYVDFIDDDIQSDFVTTNREGLIWEREELQVLKKWLVEKIQSVEKQWSEKRTQLKEDAIYTITGYKPREWIDTLPKRKQNLANNWVNSIYKDNSINEKRQEN